MTPPVHPAAGRSEVATRHEVEVLRRELRAYVGGKIDCLVAQLILAVFVATSLLVGIAGLVFAVIRSGQGG
jgi:hypothetical protein